MHKLVLTVFVGIIASAAHAADLAVELGNLESAVGGAQNIALVGAIARWDADGNAKRTPDTKAKIDAPYVDATAKHEGGNRWLFRDLPKGKYDLVVLSKDRLRLEGFCYVPIKEFDPFFSGDAKVDDEDTREFILGDIKKSPHYENIVEPLYLGGQEKAVRVLMMLVRDKATSYESDLPNAATIRHEMWQYTEQYGVWQKEKRTKVLDRIIVSRDELHKWTWLWDPKLGGIEIAEEPVAVKYALPDRAAQKKGQGLRPR